MPSTVFSQPFSALSCAACRDPQQLPFAFTMAFQPILDLRLGRPAAYEALVRGPEGESATSILAQVNDSNRYRFDQACRVKAIELAASLGLAAMDDCRLSINFLPNAVYRPETCIRATLEAAREARLPVDRLMFEVTEGEQVRDADRLAGIFAAYKRQGMITAIDDFGAGYAGLTLLARFQPHVIKLDMELIRDIDSSPVKQAIVAGVMLVCTRLGIDVIAEGVETAAESACLREHDIHLQQGYHFARPGFESLPLA